MPFHERPRPSVDGFPYDGPKTPTGPLSQPPIGTQPTPPTPEGAPPEPAPVDDRWAQPPADGNWEQWFLQNTQGIAPTPANLIALEKQLEAHGIKVLRNAEGVAGKIRLPDGTIIDVIKGAAVGGEDWQWLTGAGAAAAAASAPTLGSLTSNLSAAGLTAFQEQMRQMILQQLAGASQPVDPNSPEIRLPIGEAERQAEQIRRRRQSAEAERLTQQGIGDSGALDTARRQGFEDMSQTISGVTAQIIGEHMQNKRRELVTLLTAAMASGDAEAARQVQLQIAAIDAELRQIGMAQQQSQFDSSMDLGWAQHHAGLL